MAVYDQSIVVIRLEYKFHQDELIPHNVDQSKRTDFDWISFWIQTYIIQCFGG